MVGRRKLTWPGLLAAIATIVLSASGAAQDGGEESSVFSLGKHLRLEPKALAGTSDGADTVGLEYEYNRYFSLFGGRNVREMQFESSGLFAADADASPNRQLDHKLRVSLVDLLNTGLDLRGEDFDMSRDSRGEEWYRLKPELLTVNVADPNFTKFVAAVRSWELERGKASPDPKELKKHTDAAKKAWKDLTGEELDQELEAGLVEFLTDVLVKPSAGASSSPRSRRGLPWLSLELNVGAETDQDFGDVQYTGGGRLYGKFPWLDDRILNRGLGYLRGYERPKWWRNSRGGPYLWAGVDVVDATQNESRKAITGGSDESFGRFSAGAWYRNELFSLGTDSPEDVVSLEVAWDFYAEIDAPDAIKQADQDVNSFVRLTVFFKDEYFIEYIDGSRPLDLRDSSAVAVGWRFGR